MVNANIALPGTYILTLNGDSGAARIWRNTTSNATPLLTIGQTVTNGQPVTFNATRDEVWLEPIAPSRTTLTYAFQGTGIASNITSTYTLPTTIAKIWLEPVTTETAPGKAIINPAATMTRGLSQFAIHVLPESIRDEAITWNIVNGAGNIAFYNTGNKGRAVNVRGTAEGDFKLEVTIGATNYPPVTPKPYIRGTVTNETVTPLYFYVARPTNGAPVVSTNTINAWVAEANRIYAQAAMSFTIGDIQNIPSNNWVHVVNVDALYKMFSFTNNVGGLEVYCVSSFWDNKDIGLHSPKNLGGPPRGLAVRANAPLSTLAHEIGHACNLEDIYLQDWDYLVSEGRADARNWSGGDGTGYYPPALMHSDLIQRLLMYGINNPGAIDIPLADLASPVVWDSTIQEYRPIRTGLPQMNRNPRH